MAQQTLNNGESYGVIRGKINANFAEVYASSAAAYNKPVSGIPITDMTTGVQTSLGKADTALQQAAADVRYVRTVGGIAPDGTGNVPAGGAGGVTNLTYTASPTSGLVVSDTGTDATLPLADGTNAGLMAPAQVTKLAGVAAGATANSTDATLLNRANHTGTQLAATISDFSAAADARVSAAVVNTLVSTSTTAPLSAAQGKALKDTADALATTVAGKADVGVPGAFTSRALTNADYDDTLVCATAQAATVNTGLMSGFCCSFKGAVSFAGTATVTDLRSSGQSVIWCTLTQTGTDTYDVLGGKA